MSLSVPVGTGSASASVSAGKSTVKSEYASVNAQSGIQAGDDGFQVEVKGNTDLKGAVIASTDQAVVGGKNRLTTTTLTTSDIQNKADANAQSSDFGLSSDILGQGKYGVMKTVLSNALGTTKESASSSGVTRSAVSAGVVTITDDAKQTAQTGKTAEQTVAGLNRDTVNAQVAAVKQDVEAMKQAVPDSPSWSSSWLWPYSNTRSPDPAMQKHLEQEKGSLKIAAMGWENCIFLGCMSRRGDVSGLTMTYRILKPEEITGKFSTPEKLQQGSRDLQNFFVEQALARRGNNPIVSDAELETRRIALAPEIVTINGRIWVRDAMNDYMGRNYVYVTTLLPDRMFSVVFGMPNGHDYNAQPDPASWPRSAKRAFENMEQMAASLRVVKRDDDGSFDPFVVERVEPGPLPVREKRPGPDRE